MGKTLAKRYISEVKLLLPSVHRQERVYLGKMEHMIEDFCQEQSAADMDMIYQEFGTPQDTVADYFTTMDTAQLIALFRMRRLKRWAILALSACIVALALFIAGMLCETHHAFLRAEPFFTEKTTNIIEGDSP